MNEYIYKFCVHGSNSKGEYIRDMCMKILKILIPISETVNQNTYHMLPMRLWKDICIQFGVPGQNSM